MSSEPLSAQNLLCRCNNLLSELRTLQTCLDGRRENGAKDVRNFINHTQSERRSLEKLAATSEGKTDDIDRIQHGLKSSNLPFLEAVWARAKCERGLVALNKKIHDNTNKSGTKIELINHNERSNLKEGHKRRAQSLRSSIDIVCEHGLRWIKVSLVSEKRLLFELAENGWNFDDESSDDESISNKELTMDTKSTSLSIERTAELLINEARRVRLRYRHPEIVLDLPNIQWGKVREIDDVLEGISRSGVTVRTADNKQPAPILADILDKMLSVESREFSSTINIDCTILLSLVSDISHSDRPASLSQSSIIQKQIEIEAKEKLLPNVLYPIMRKRKLVCTREAAAHMQDLVNTIGTPHEKRRAALIMGHDEALTHDEIIQEFSNISSHTVPIDLQFPLSVKPDGNSSDPNLPAVANAVASALKHPINKSVFLYGWANDSTTITSNAVVAKQIERVVEENRSSSAEIGPDVWLCSIPRSLVGKEPRQRRK